jgi:hypothetical protein
MNHFAKSTPPPGMNSAGDADEEMTMPAFSFQPASTGS